MTQRRDGRSIGRPSFEVDLGAVKYLGVTVKDIAHIFGVSRQTIYNKTKSSGNAAAITTYLTISDGDLDTVVTRIEAQHPNNGEIMIAGFLPLREFAFPGED